MALDILKPKLDIMFKMIFADENNSDMLKRFLSDTLDIPYDEITEIQIENSEIPPNEIEGKLSRMDIRVSVKNRIIDVEVQLKNEGSFGERSLFYWARLYSEELKRGEIYSELKKGIVLNIVDFNIFPETEDYHSKFVPLEETRHELLSDRMEIHFCELPKVGMDEGTKEPRKAWMQFINAESEEDLDMLRQTEIPEIKKGIRVVKDLSADKLARERVRAREDAVREYNNAIHFARTEGKAEGAASERREIINKMKAAGMKDSDIERILSMSA